MSADLLPDHLISMSDCICDFIPDLWALEWAQATPEDQIEEAAQFDVAPDQVQEIVDWSTQKMDIGVVGYPCLFYGIGDARDFASRFLNVPDLRLVGISLPADHVDDYLSSQKPAADQGEPGIYPAICDRRDTTSGGTDLGWEPLCYEHGGFHSWLCNSLEVEVAKDLAIRPGPSGFLDSASDGLRAAEYCGREEVGAEPGFWAPWLVTEYPVKAEGSQA